MADYAGANPSYALWSTHGKTPDLHNELRKRLPTLHCESREKGRTKAEVDQVISWLTGYGQKQLETQLEKQTDFETFFAKAPKINPSRALIKGVVCGVRVEDIKEPTMREIRYLDKLIDELAQGKTMDKILRKT